MDECAVEYINERTNVDKRGFHSNEYTSKWKIFTTFNNIYTLFHIVFHCVVRTRP